MEEKREQTRNLLQAKLKSTRLSTNAEKSIYNSSIEFASQNNIDSDWDNRSFVHIYTCTVTTVMLYLNDDDFLEKVLAKEIQAKDLGYIKTNEVFTKEWAENREDDLDPANVEDGVFTCKMCGSKKTTYYSLQTRSADEPMTNFITCVMCKHRWKI